nr:hypothetical protein [Homoserinibacter gongjuensis]
MTTPAASARAASSADSAAERVSGFSQKTLTPRARLLRTRGAWKRVGVAMMTASTSTASSAASRSGKVRIPVYLPSTSRM